MQPNCKDCGMSDGMHVLSCPYPLGSKQALTYRDGGFPVPKPKQRKGVKLAVEVGLPDKLGQWAKPAKQLRKIPAAAYTWAFGFFISASIAAVPFVVISAATHGTDGGAAQKAIITVCVILGLILGVLTGGMTIETVVDRHQQRKKAGVI